MWSAMGECTHNPIHWCYGGLTHHPFDVMPYLRTYSTHVTSSKSCSAYIYIAAHIQMHLFDVQAWFQAFFIL